MKKSRFKSRKSGLYDGEERLTKFGAKIVQETEIHDRTGFIERTYTIKTQREGELPVTSETDALGLERATWITDRVGPRGAFCVSDYKRVLLALMETREKCVVREYCSLGYQVIDGNPVYVHGNGVLLPSGTTLENIKARPPESFSGYGFPDSSSDTDEPTKYLEAPLKLLRLSKKNPAIGVIVLASAVRSVLCEFHPSVVTPILIGETGAGKSELLALATSLFRPGTDVNSLPFNTTSTVRGLQLVVQASAHTLCPIDDYYPTQGKHSDNDDFVEMLIFGGSTTGARVTAKSATESATGEGIRTVAMLTAEVALVTDKESRQARAMYCEVGNHEVDPKLRKACLEHAQNGDLARAMCAFIVASLSRHEKLALSVPKQFEDFQRKAGEALPDLHRRHWANVADLMLGVYYYLRFCKTEGIIDDKLHASLLNRSWAALIALAKAQRNLVQRYSEGGVVGRGFENLLKSGKYHVLPVGTDGVPNGVRADRVGWLDGKPQGKLLGHLDSAAQVIYVATNIDAKALYDALPRDAQKLLACGPKKFWALMDDHGLIRPGEEGRNASRVYGQGSARFYKLSIPGLFR